MVRGCVIDVIWLLAVLEVQLDILEESGLVSFDGEMIMRFTFLDQVISEFSLGKQGIGCNGFAFDIDGI